MDLENITKKSESNKKAKSEVVKAEILGYYMW